MFNNPFREQAIAASASRQQLDRLLRVTAPHERMALVAVGLILVGVGAWILFGEVDRAVELDCVVVMTGQDYQDATSDPQDRRLQAALYAAPRVARLLQPGMEASVDVHLPSGATWRLEGSVGATTAEWSPAGDSEAMATTTAAGRRVEINLPPVPDLELPEGTPCRARIVHGRYSPATLLGLG